MTSPLGLRAAPPPPYASMPAAAAAGALLATGKIHQSQQNVAVVSPQHVLAKSPSHALTNVIKRNGVTVTVR